MTASYDTDEINDLSRANVSIATTTLVPLTAETLRTAADVGLADLAALIADPPALALLRGQLVMVVGDSVEAKANTALLGSRLYHQAVIYISNETGLPPTAVVAQQLVDRGVDTVEGAWRYLDDAYFGDINTATLDKEAEEAGPDRIIEWGVTGGGSYKIAVGDVEVGFRIEVYDGVYRVVMTITTYGGVGVKGRDGIDVGVEQTVEVAWDLADEDSARRLITRLGNLSGPALNAAILAWANNPAALAAGGLTVLAGGLLGIPEPSTGSIAKGPAFNAEAGGASAGAGVMGGASLDFSGSGFPSVTPFGSVQVEADLDLGGVGSLSGSADVKVDPSGVEISLAGIATFGPGVSAGDVDLSAGVGYEVEGKVKVPAGVIDPALYDRIRLGDPRAVAELLDNIWDDGTGRINLYEVVEGEAGFDGGVVSIGASGSVKDKVGTFEFGD